MRTAKVVFKLVFALLALFMGISIILWVVYNEFVHRLPEYERPPFLGIFGIAPAMIAVGFYWARSAWMNIREKQFRESKDRHSR